MSQTKNNSTIIENETGLGFGSGIAFGVVMGLVGYFMISSGKGKKLLGYINELATQPNLDTPQNKNTGSSPETTSKAMTDTSLVNEVDQVKSMLSQLTSRFHKLSAKQKRLPYTNS